MHKSKPKPPPAKAADRTAASTSAAAAQRNHDLDAGIHEDTLTEDALRKRRDTELLSIFPSGLPAPAGKNAKKYDLLYDWEHAKGREKDLRSPSIKPEATNEDAEVLSVFRRKSATIAWEHLQMMKPPPSNAEESETDKNTSGNKRSHSLKPATPVPQVTQTSSTGSQQIVKEEHLNPPLRRPGEAEPEEEPEPEQIEPEPEPEPVKVKPKPEPRKSRRRTLIERTADYKRNNHCCSPVRVVCIHSPCWRNRRKKAAAPTWQLCWDCCGLTYRKIPPAPANDNLFCSKFSGQNWNGEPYRGSPMTTATTAFGGNDDATNCVLLKPFPIVNIYQRPKMSTQPGLSLNGCTVRPEERRMSGYEASSYGDSDDTVSDSLCGEHYGGRIFKTNKF